MNEKMNVKQKGGDEVDAFTRWKHMLVWKAGERKRIKRKYHRRNRKHAREELKGYY